MFQAYKGGDVRGDIAIDDVQLIRDEACPKIYDCNFETNCTWRDVVDPRLAQLTWTRRQANDQFDDHSISTDATGNKEGYFAILEPVFPNKYGDKVRIISCFFFI